MIFDNWDWVKTESNWQTADRNKKLIKKTKCQNLNKTVKTIHVKSKDVKNPSVRFFFQTVKKFLVKTKDDKTPGWKILQTVEKILVKFKDVKIQMVDHHFELAGKNRKES